MINSENTSVKMGDNRYALKDIPSDEKVPEQASLLSEHKDKHEHHDPEHTKKRKSLLDLQDKDLEVVVSPGEPMTPKDVEAMHDNAPQDRYHLVYLIFLIHGIAVLMPWNMFITANDYFVKHKLTPSINGTTNPEEKSLYRDYFLGSLCFVAQVPNILLNAFNLFCQVGSGSTSKRITWSIIVIVVVFIATVVLAIVDSSQWPAAFFWITMACVVIINSANGIYQNSVYGLAACLPSRYTSAVVLGSNTSGAITAIISLASLAMAPDLRISAIYYFLTAVVVLLVAFDSFFGLQMTPYFNYYLKKAEGEKKKLSQENEGSSFLKVYLDVFRITWKEDLCVFFVFFVTLTCFPAIQAGIGRVECQFIGEKYFTAVTCFLLFNMSAMLGSFLANFTQFPGCKWSWLPILLRVLFIPFFMFCNFKPATRTFSVWFANDYVYCAGGFLMALSGGYFSSLSMMFAPRNVEDKHKGVAGMMAAFCLIVGIFCGIVFSFPVAAFIENAGSFNETFNETRFVCLPDNLAVSASDSLIDIDILFNLSSTALPL